MRKLIVIALMALLPSFGFAAAGNVHLDKANIDPTDKESLIRGSKTFMQYCHSCHGIQFMRFNRMGADLGISDEVLKAEYMFTSEKVGDQMAVALGKDDASSYFGTKVPDLSLVSRSRGVDWLYTYMRTFYADPSRPFGVNNVVFPDVGMPHVLWDLQGIPTVVKVEKDGHSVIEKLEPGQPGKLSGEEYDSVVRDLVNFLSYVGEPMQVQRTQLGVWVLIFLSVFAVFAYLLKKEYWKDVH